MQINQEINQNKQNLILSKKLLDYHESQILDYRYQVHIDWKH